MCTTDTRSVWDRIASERDVRVETARRTVAGLVAENLWERGTTRSETGKYTLDLAGKCENPFLLEMTGRPDPVLSALGKESERPLFTDAWVRCRRCVWCLRQRSNMWTARVASELTRAPRTWMLTLTLSSENQHRMLCVAGVAGKAMDTEEWEFKARHWAISQEITKYLKRVRKETRFRYALVCERHDGKRGKGANYGLPHYHAVIHEYPDEPLRMAPVRRDDGTILHDKKGRPYWEGVLSEKWGLGFVTVKEVDTSVPVRAARYVAKYLAKDARCRVRASQRYGAAPQVLQEVVLTDIGKEFQRSWNVSLIDADRWAKNHTHPTETSFAVNLDPSPSPYLFPDPTRRVGEGNRRLTPVEEEVSSEANNASVPSGIQSRSEGVGLRRPGFQTACAPNSS